MAIASHESSGVQIFVVTALAAAPPPVRYPLTIGVSGNGTVVADTGTVGWNGPVGTCECDAGTQVRLTARATAGSIFSGWSGCDVTASGACDVTMSAARTVGASFAACGYRITPPGPESYKKNGGSGTVVVAALAGCSWTAVSNADWITITSGAAGSGAGTVLYSVARNQESKKVRTGTISVAGLSFTVNQAK